jgi:hypothetical protein
VEVGEKDSKVLFLLQYLPQLALIPPGSWGIRGPCAGVPMSSVGIVEDLRIMVP